MLSPNDVAPSDIEIRKKIQSELECKMTQRCWLYSFSAFLGPIEIIWADFGPRKLNGIYGLRVREREREDSTVVFLSCLAFSIISSHKLKQARAFSNRVWFS